MIKGGPKIINDGLVLCLDAHDAKSYAGEPTTNFSTNPKFETGTHDSSSGGTWNNWVFGTWYSYNHKIVDVTDAGMIASGFTKALRVTSDGTSNSQHLSNNNWGSNITAGTVFSLSFWGRASASDTTWIYSQWGGTVGYPEFTTEWKYFKFDNITKAASSGSQYPYFRFEYGPPPSGQWFEVTGFQVEAKSYSTPLADTSRSATNGWVDRSGNSNSGTLVNMVGTGASHYRDGQVIMPVSASYLRFDGSNDQVIISQNSAINLSANSPYTLEYWVSFNYLTSTDFAATLMKGWFTTSYGHLFIKNTNDTNTRILVYTDDDSSPELTVDYPISTATWYHIVQTFSGGTAKLYVNGELEGSASGLTATSNTSDLRLGSNAGSNYFMNGDLAKVSIYNIALTDAQVLNNYNATKGRFL